MSENAIRNGKLLGREMSAETDTDTDTDTDPDTVSHVHVRLTDACGGVACITHRARHLILCDA